LSNVISGLLLDHGQSSYIEGQTTEIDLGSRRYSWERRKDLISKYWRHYFRIADNSEAGKRVGIIRFGRHEFP